MAARGKGGKATENGCALLTPKGRGGNSSRDKQSGRVIKCRPPLLKVGYSPKAAFTAFPLKRSSFFLTNFRR